MVKNWCWVKKFGVKRDYSPRAGNGPMAQGENTASGRGKKTGNPGIDLPGAALRCVERSKHKKRSGAGIISKRRGTGVNTIAGKSGSPLKGQGKYNKTGQEYKIVRVN